MGKHQKLTPTVGEKLVHTGGFGDTLRAIDTEFGKIAGLICGESSNQVNSEAPSLYLREKWYGQKDQEERHTEGSDCKEDPDTDV